MTEQEIRNLVEEVREGSLPRRSFIQKMVGAGISAPMASMLLMHYDVAQAQSAPAYKPTKRGGGGRRLRCGHAHGHPGERRADRQHARQVHAARVVLGGEALRLDIAASLRLFGGLEALVGRVRADLAAMTAARASASVVGSGTVGPEPITPGSSLGTSEISQLSTRAGCAAIARRPPLIADRCFRTVFISTMLAPERSKARLTSCLSARDRPGAGRASSAEAPPEIRQSRRG